MNKSKSLQKRLNIMCEKNNNEFKTVKFTLNFVPAPNKTPKQLKNHFLKGTGNFDWHWNITQQVWGFGTDAGDWEKAGDDWVDNSEIEDIDIKTKTITFKP